MKENQASKELINLLGGLQWLSFMFANTIVIPLSVGAAYHLSATEISGSIARSFILTGVACLLQITLGHGLPLLEGQSGFWWGMALSLVTMGTASGVPISEIGGSLAVGMILGGVLVAVLGVFGLHKLLNKLFTPVVMAVLLILLAAQLIDTFMQGMLGIAQTGQVAGGLSLFSLSLAAFVGILVIKGKGFVSHFAILLGIVLGWIGYTLILGNNVPQVVPTWAMIAQTFVWGNPAWNVGIIIAAVLTALINTTNTIATLRVAEPVLGTTLTDRQYKRSLVWTGSNTILAAIFSLIGYTPYISSIAFLRTTRLVTATPFVVGAILFIGMGLFPPLVGFFSTLPMSVGDAVLFVAYLQLFGSALQSIEGVHFTFRTIFRLAAPVALGLAIQSFPSHAFSSLPGFIRAIVGNGMLVGILVAIILENTVRWHMFEDPPQKMIS